MRIVLVGGGGHASDVLGVIEDLNDAGGLDGSLISVAGILDDAEVDVTRFAGRSVHQVGALGDLAGIDATHYVLAVGWPKSRRAIHDRLGLGGPADAADGIDPATGPTPATLVHPTATVGRGVTIGAGAVVMAGVHLSPMSSVGRHACLSNHAVLGHDSVVGDFAGLMPASVVSGGAVVGEGCLVGTNATVVEGISLGPWSTLGAGGVAVRDVEDGTVVVGVPARPTHR